ncbi:MAG: hypothetical protein IJW32_00480 [Clostridia bacterium]|nr:hypothetical protein [Clostridia bacterium]
MNKHFLASANTCKGFKNNFNSINISSNGFTYILKGGPGTGKSTIMKRFGKSYEDKGYDVEYFYCSSDPESLDGVFIPKKNISIVDGTAPHITEATVPGIKEKIINVGAFIKPSIKKHKKTIEENLQKKSMCFKLAYSYLNAVSSLIKCEEIENEKQKRRPPFNFKEVVSLLPQKKKGKKRTLFCSFVSSKGLKHIYHKNRYKEVIPLKGNYFENTKILSDIEKGLEENNYNFICFKSILNPELNEAIFLESTQTLVLSFNPKSDFFENFKNKNTIKNLLCLAGKYIEKAKYYHKKVEKYYIENMDFDALSSFIKKQKELY